MTNSGKSQIPPIELTINEEFEIERHLRLIEEISDLKVLQNMAKLLLRSWMAQRAATRWAIKTKF